MHAMLLYYYKQVLTNLNEPYHHNSGFKTTFFGFKLLPPGAHSSGLQGLYTQINVGRTLDEDVDIHVISYTTM